MALPAFAAAAAAKVAAASAKVGAAAAKTIGKNTAQKAASSTVNAVKGNAGTEQSGDPNIGDIAAGLIPGGKAKAATGGAAQAAEKTMPGGIWGVIGVTAFILILTMSLMVGIIASLLSSLMGGTAGSDAAVKSIQYCGLNSTVASSPVPGIHPITLDAINKAAARYNIDWTILAGFMSVESSRGIKGEGMDANGNFSPGIYGPALDGSGDGGNYTPYPDTDNGKYDNDKVWDRAVGPTQFMMATWLRYKQDGNGDGKEDPQNIYDAVFSSANHLVQNNARKNPERALALYNGGPNGANKKGSHAWTVYVPDVWKFVEKYRALDISVAPTDPGVSGATGADLIGDDIGVKTYPVLGDPIVNAEYNIKGPWAIGYHTGIDFDVPNTEYETIKIDLNTSRKVAKPQVPIVAAAGGRVTYAADTSAPGKQNYGQVIKILHPDGMTTLYAHLSEINVTNGQVVVAGQQIGRGGKTGLPQYEGRDGGEHLHFEVLAKPYEYGDDVDPKRWLRGAEKISAPVGAGSTGVVNTNLASGSGSKVFIVGDSLTVGVRDIGNGTAILNDGFGASAWTINAESGRGTPAAISILRDTKKAQVASTWIVAMGTNDGVSSQQYRQYIDEVMRMAGTERSVMWVNIYRPKQFAPEVDPVNVALNEATGTWANLTIADWASLAAANPKWMAADQIHYNAKGYEARARLYTETLRVATQNVDCQSDVMIAGGGRAGDSALKALDFAVSQMNKPWYGSGVGPDTYSSPGLIWRAFSEQGLKWSPMTTTALTKSENLIKIGDGTEQPGDLVVFTVTRENNLGLPRTSIGTKVVGIISEPGTGEAVASLPYGTVTKINYRDGSGELMSEVSGLYLVRDTAADSTYRGNTSGGCEACVRFALAQVGEPYVAGGPGPNQWDCSTLTAWAWKEAGIDLTPLSDAQFLNETVPVNVEDLQPGDLLFYNTSTEKRTGHVAIYIGNGEMVHAANPSRGVVREKMDKYSYYVERFIGAGRPKGWTG